MARAIAHGASGYIPKSVPVETIVGAVQTVLGGDVWLPPGEADAAARVADLTPQQFRVLTMIAEGLLNKQIADRLDIQERTVKAHLSVIFEKLGARNRTQAGVILRELEIGDPSRQAPD